MATTYVLGTDVNFHGTRLRAGKVVSDAHYQISLLVAAGAILIPSAASGATARATTLQQRSRDGASPTMEVAERVDVVDSFLGPSGGGGGAASLPVTLANGDNDKVDVPAQYTDVVVTGPTGAYALKGFSAASAVANRRIRVKFNVNQQLTIKNNSSAGTPILTGTGADVVFAAPGGFVILDFWCDGTNFNVV
jgi:hypothetical protein